MIFKNILKNAELVEGKDSIFKVKGTDIICKVSEGKTYKGPQGDETENIQKWYYDGDIAIIVTILDYVIPALGTKKYGGTRYGIWGTTIGLIVGLILPIPFGFLIGAFAGAYIGEMMYDNKDSQRALRAAFGSFIGFLGSTFLKLVVGIGFIWWFVGVVIEYKEAFFSF